MYDACNEWTSAVKKTGKKFLGGDQPNLADLVSQSTAVCAWTPVFLVSFQHYDDDNPWSHMLAYSQSLV